MRAPALRSHPRALMEANTHCVLRRTEQRGGACQLRSGFQSVEANLLSAIRKWAEGPSLGQEVCAAAAINSTPAKGARCMPGPTHKPDHHCRNEVLGQK